MHEINVPLVQHVTDSTVALVSKDIDGDLMSYCTGVWINHNHIVTAKHCVANDDDSITIGQQILYQTKAEQTGKSPINGSDVAYTAKIVAHGELSDVAVLKVEDNLSHGIVSIYKGQIPQGLKVYVMGHPNGLMYTYTEGIVSGIRTMKVYFSDEGEVHYIVHIQVPAAGGSSGGPAITANGELVAISTFINRGIPGNLFSTHKDKIIGVLEANGIAYY